jgi:hypothetical protein
MTEHITRVAFGMHQAFISNAIPLRRDARLGTPQQTGLRGRPAACSRCGGEMQIVAFLEKPEVIAKILTRPGL